MTNSWILKEIACNVSILRTFIEFNSLCISIKHLSFDINEMHCLFFWNGLCPVKDFWIVFFFASKIVIVDIRWSMATYGIRDTERLFLYFIKIIRITWNWIERHGYSGNWVKQKKRKKNMLHKVITKLIWFSFKQTSMAAHDYY